MGYNYRLNRPDLHKKICEKVGIKKNSNTPGYFDTLQLRQLLEYTEKVEAELNAAKQSKPVTDIQTVRV